MLLELAVRDLGVINELSLILAPGMTAVTGETGAGKTLVVEAIELLVGGRADGTMVRHGATEAVVEGLFLLDDGGESGRERSDEAREVVVRRVVPRDGRSRAYIDGRLATAAALAELGRGQVDLHGQHDHQSLLSTAVQRAALDRFAGIDIEPLLTARKALAELDARLVDLGGDERARAREADLLRFQVAELVDAGLVDAAEDERLEEEEDELSQATGHQEAAQAALSALDVDDGAAAEVATAVAALEGRRPLEPLATRLRDVLAELTDIAGEVRSVGEGIEQDPDRQAEVRDRRRLLHELRRKYGETLDEVIAYRDESEVRLAELDDRDRLAAALDAERRDAQLAVEAAEHVVGAARRSAAPHLAAATEAHLAELAMPRARMVIDVGPDPGDDVTFLLAANPGGPPLPLARTASGGELARSMLALRLVLSEAPPTLVFDEVDAGIGGTAASAVGRALASLGADHQVLVVTHLPQVAAAADAHVEVRKQESGDVTVTTAALLDEPSRVVEIARMLSGSPDSETAQRHATELLDDSSRWRGR
jgi:DNA repair protein RecN (Recombination protein N)